MLSLQEKGRTKKHFFVTTIVVACVSPWVLRVNADDSANVQAKGNFLAPFERLVGGQWHLEGSYQEFEWGVGKRSVKSRSYFVADGKPTLVSEGIWFWHPGEKQIKGYFTAIDIPFQLFDYTTRFEGNRMVSDLHSYAGNGSRRVYVETWEFKDDKRYEWKLLKKSPEGLKQVLEGIYSRKMQKLFSPSWVAKVQA